MIDTPNASLSWGVATTSEERDEIYRFRYAVYVEEMHKQLACADHSKKMISDDIDEHATILFVRDGAQVVGTVRSLNAGDYLPETYQNWFDFGRFASVPLGQISITSRLMVAEPYRSGNVLGILLTQIYEAGRAEGVWLNLIHCAPSVVTLQESLGYRRISPHIVDTDVGQHLTLALVADDLKHLTAMRSILLASARRYPADPSHSAWFATTFAQYLAPASARALGLDAFISRLGHRLASESGALLDGITLEEVASTLSRTSIIRACAGDFILRRGDVGSEIFVILEGAAEARCSVQDRHQVPRTMGKGDVFGEIAVLGNGRRSADVVALGDIEVLVLTPDFLERLTREHPLLAGKLYRNLATILAERLISKEEVPLDDTANGAG